MKRRRRALTAARVLFPVEDKDTNKDPSTLVRLFDPNSNSSTMTSPFFHQTLDSQQSQTQMDVDNYVESLDGDFHTRLRFWIEKTPGVSTYAVQLAAIFEAGSCINTNMLEKTPEKLKEMATKYQAVVKKIGLDGILLPSETMKMKTLKHATAKKKKQDIVEVEGWPTGKSLWDRYLNCRKEIRNTVNPNLPETIADTPSGTGLIKAFEQVGFQLFIATKDGKDFKDEDPHSPDVQEAINKLQKYPFTLLLTAKVFYGKAVLSSDMAELQQVEPPATKATLKVQQRLQKKERQRAKQLEEDEKAKKKAKKAERLQSMEAKSMRVKAVSMLKIADGQNLKTYFDIAKLVMSPESLKAEVGPHLANFSSTVFTMLLVNRLLVREVDEEF